MRSANPFLKSSRIKLLNVHQEDIYIKHNTFDIDIKFNKFTKKEVCTFTTDPCPKTNLYQQIEGYSCANVIFELSSGACQLFMYIALMLPKGQDWMYLKVKDYCKKANLSNVTVYKYLDDLAENALIAKKQNGQIWINPNFIFNGDRTEYFRINCPECIQEVDVHSTPESRAKKQLTYKKKDLIELLHCNSYYELKKKIGKEQIEMYIKGNLQIEDLKLLR